MVPLAFGNLQQHISCSFKLKQAHYPLRIVTWIDIQTFFQNLGEILSSNSTLYLKTETCSNSRCKHCSEPHCLAQMSEVVPARAVEEEQSLVDRKKHQLQQLQDDEGLLPVLLENYLDKAGVM